jgi:cellulose synthase/poly-beta-1,6-N-acetylglucosamine synthase-like glycosyltransferase
MFDNSIFENLIPEFINFWIEGGTSKFIRVFWYFIIFELTRYILLDYFVYAYRWFTKSERNEKWVTAKRKLFLENPFISIVVPGKNEGKNIYKLVKSLAEQTYQNFELIIVDDGSTDDTPIIGKNLLDMGLIDKFMRNDVRGGKASAANLAVRFSTGKYIVHLDADCSFDHDAIENIIIPFYIDSKIGAVGGNVKVRNYMSNLVSKLQAIEYLKTISVGRITTSELGIYKIITNG